MLVTVKDLLALAEARNQAVGCFNITGLETLQAVLGAAEKEIMEKAYERLGLSARSYHKVLRVARTIADLEEKEKIEGKHLREALSYRNINHGYRRH